MVVKSVRQERMARELQRQLSTILLYELKNPLDPFLSITRVQISRDLRFAKVFVSSLKSGAEERRETLRRLKSLRRVLLQILSRKMKIRYLPELHFVYDESIERGVRISHLIDQVCGPETPKKSISHEEE